MKSPQHVSKRINLIPSDLRPQRVMSVDHILITAGACIGLFVIATYIPISGVNKDRKGEFAELSKAKEQLNRKLAEVKPVVEASLKTTAKGSAPAPTAAQSMKALEDVLKNKNVWSEPLKELSGLIPNGVWVTKLTAAYDKSGGRAITLSGSAPSSEKVTDFYSVLEKSYFFRNVLMGYSERQKDTQPQMYNYEFSVPLKRDSKVVASESR